MASEIEEVEEGQKEREEQGEAEPVAEPVQTEAEKQLARIEARLGGMDETKVKSAQAELERQLLADPEFRAVLDAKKRGQRVKVVPDEPDLPTPEQMDSLPTSKLVDVIVQKASAASAAKSDEKIQELTRQVQFLIKHVQDGQGEKIEESVKQAREKHTDFDTYTQDMIKLSEKHTSLGTEDLYLLAKAKKSRGTPPKQSQVETERPGGAAGRQALPKGKIDFGHGEADFSAGLRQALKKLKVPALSDVQDED
jgi:hypothetical protein